MPLTLDHIVIAVADLGAASADFVALGFTVEPGGEHGGGRQTHNALVVLEDGAYLELIAFRRPDPDDRWSRVFERSGEGFVDFALLPGDIDLEVSAAQGRGLDIHAPVPGSRLRPDGRQLAWKTARSARSDIPFLCGDVTPRALRVREGDVRHHPNRITGVAEVSVAVEDRAESLRRYESLLGRPPAAPDGRFQVGATTIGLVSRADGEWVAAALDARGEGPCAVAFASPGQGLDLAPAKTHGARLSVVHRASSTA